MHTDIKIYMYVWFKMENIHIHTDSFPSPRHYNWSRTLFFLSWELVLKTFTIDHIIS